MATAGSDRAGPFRPSITLDTRWCSRADLTNETETYSLSGSMLSTMDDNGAMSVAHRGDKIARKSDRQFYTRQGGDFSRIIRKGSSPADYYWELPTSRACIYLRRRGRGAQRHHYRPLRNTREVISEWKLKRVVETHGDWIEYEYTAVDEPVRGGLVAKAIYLSKVSAAMPRVTDLTRLSPSPATRQNVRRPTMPVTAT